MLHERVFDASETIRSHPGAFESARQSTIRRVHVRIEWGGGHSEHLLWIVTG